MTRTTQNAGGRIGRRRRGKMRNVGGEAPRATRRRRDARDRCSARTIKRVRRRRPGLATSLQSAKEEIADLRERCRRAEREALLAATQRAGDAAAAAAQTKKQTRTEPPSQTTRPARVTRDRDAPAARPFSHAHGGAPHVEPEPVPGRELPAARPFSSAYGGTAVASSPRLARSTRGARSRSRAPRGSPVQLRVPRRRERAPRGAQDVVIPRRGGSIQRHFQIARGGEIFVVGTGGGGGARGRGDGASPGSHVRTRARTRTRPGGGRDAASHGSSRGSSRTGDGARSRRGTSGSVCRGRARARARG